MQAIEATTLTPDTFGIGDESTWDWGKPVLTTSSSQNADEFAIQFNKNGVTDYDAWKQLFNAMLYLNTTNTKEGPTGFSSQQKTTEKEADELYKIYLNYPSMRRACHWSTRR